MHLYSKNRKFRYRKIVTTLVAFIVLLLVFVYLVGNTDSTAAKRGQELVRQAVTRAAVTCYTIEGRYPASLDYLIENYGLIVNTDKYHVKYDAFGDNMMPQIIVVAIPER